MSARAPDPAPAPAPRCYLDLHMTRTAFDTFSMSLAAGWAELAYDPTYSDPTEGSRTAFGRPGSSGVLHVSLLPIDPDDPPSDAVEDVEALARGWGRARGLTAPLSVATERREDGVLAGAEYRLAGDYVAVWYLSNGEATLHASYLCAWQARDEDRAARDEMIRSLTFG